MGQDGGKQAGSDPQEQNPQEISSQDDGTRPNDQAAELFQQETNSSTMSTTANYEANREDRLQKSPGWFKEQHPVPPAGDSNRQHLYAHNPPISDDEFAETLQAFNNSTTNAETGARDSLATHQRPCTPPIERARRQVQSLEEQGVQLTEDLEKEIIDNMIHNMGLAPALTEWCENEADIPVEYANELLKEIDRLKLEMAKQQRDLHEKLASQMKAIEDFQAQKEGREKAEQEVERYKVFHNNLFKEAKTHEQTWVLANGAVVESPKENEKAARAMVSNAAKDWSDLLQNYENSWPPNEEALENGKGKLDLLVQISHDNREKKKQQLDEVEKMLDEQMKRIEKKKKKLNEKADVNDKLEGLDDSSIPSSKPSFEIPRTPPGTEGLTPASSRTTLVEVGEVKSLQQQVSDLQQKLDEARKDNERLQESNGSVSDKDSTNSRPEKDDKINTLEKENEGLKAKLEGQMKEMNELHQGIAKSQQIEGHQDQSDEVETSDTDSEDSSSVEIEDLKEKLEEKTQDQKREINKNEALTRRIAYLQINMRHFHRQTEGQRNRLEELERVNFTTADRLVEAIGSEKEEFDGRNGMSLVDRINYLNMATFLRTCNYMQLAIREKSHPMANILMNDAQKWFVFCQKDLAKMEPSVRIQMKASMHILNGARRALITRNQKITRDGREGVLYGMEYLEKYPEGPAFEQLRRLAHTVIERTNDQQPFYKRGLFGRKRVQNRIRDDPSMKASELRRAGLHSPLSPSQWDTSNLDEDIPIGKIDQGN